MPRDILLALGLGASAGLLYAGAATGTLGGVFIAYLSQVPLFAVAFGSGLACLSLALPAALLVLIATGGGIAALAFGLTVVVPVYVLSRLALTRAAEPSGLVGWCPPGRLVVAMGTMGAIAVVAVCIGLATQVDDLQATFAGMVGEALRLRLPGEVALSQEMKLWASGVAAILPGGLVASWLTMLSINGLIAMALVNGFGQALRPPLRVADIALPPWVVGAFLAALALGIAVDGTLGYTARNVAVALAAPLLFQGLGVVHTLVRQRTGRWLPLVVFYLVLIFVAWLVVVAVVIGAIEPFARFRDRLQRRPRGGGEEDR